MVAVFQGAPQRLRRQTLAVAVIPREPLYPGGSPLHPGESALLLGAGGGGEPSLWGQGPGMQAGCTIPYTSRFLWSLVTMTMVGSQMVTRRPTLRTMSYMFMYRNQKQPQPRWSRGREEAPSLILTMSPRLREITRRDL
ncbi:uncharacterized protein LOC118412055 [Branchiostoma floridae]|uniref:Uncharacterized protein LOC118412055 n=1 Tax=Branchiostoma floridae TaxID=7739 RepID=A0A9J7MKG9_BRAFL|nr:uncharacterized protein LOC118412055 [Branchiostoma floridae]